MTTATAGLSTRPVIDAGRWPDLTARRAKVRRAVEGAIARRIFLSVARRLPVRIQLGREAIVGGAATDPTAPLMVIERPESFFAALGAGGLIGFGESYMTGDWNADDLGGLLEVFAAQMGTLVPEPLQKLRAFYVARAPHTDKNTTTNARNNIARHYDLSNDMFATFLDGTLSYSSALFEGAEDVGRPVRDEVVTTSVPSSAPTWSLLPDAQRRKIDRMLDSVGVGEGSRVLEIGTGWGELAIRAASRGARVLSVTLSSEQQALARERIAAAGHADSVDVELLDYRLVEGQFDAVVSVEMIEAVGHEYWGEYFRKIDSVLAPGGKVAVQAITMPHDRMQATKYTYTWINKYIFPGGFLPSTEAIIDVNRGQTSLRVTERLSFGQHYAETLRLWDERFIAALDRVHALGFDEVFDRMWHFYLEYSRAGFRSGYLDVQQLVLQRKAA
ncbi:cyclopropane-fatty-acyl-phospholipid synthase [Pedococcus dokdonensis]|uniref:Cyclopropane-fatty-acyl-phospholipid synthase n=1 Tax=Pedococcus dokdonensis TaxID=443156 RepID=A0A1H0L4Y9_9MICO|nr:cyclopropane-fatty-acyl-phospholipid synthase family protein [Pedococcus dokdonensis]SDO63073.1 cyclopropane-fatty-acyl-phospholipid synthase [Pedococcus dokdonensis]